MRILRNILILLCVLFLSAYMLVSFVKVTPTAGDPICRQIEAHVLDSAEFGFVSNKDVLAHLGRMHQKYIGVQFKNIDFQSLENEIAKNPFIEFVSCYYSLSGTLHIDIKQRRPAFRVMTPYGNFYIDQNRRRMPISTRFSVYVPVVTGFVDDEFLCGALFDFIDDMQHDDFWANQITQIRVLPNLEVELVPRVGNHVIVLGQVDDAEAKLDKMLTFYRKGLPYVGWNRYRTIDLRYKNQVVCTKWPNN
ncbi:MAG: cell division protein FtsQ/DivIB [Paludibacteraceae bacterium]